MERLFVYGMLMNVPKTRERFGFECISSAMKAELPGWMLCCAGLAYARQEAGSTLLGAVLTVPSLKVYDGLEGYPHHYDRMIVHPHTPYGQTDAWIYFRDGAVDHGSLDPYYGQTIIDAYHAFGHDPARIEEAIKR